MTDPIHVKHFDHANGGKRTPAEVHREMTFKGFSCTFCGDPPAVKGMLYADAAAYAEKDVAGYMELIARSGGTDPAFDSKWGRIVRVQDYYGCDRCRASLMKFLANKPDWMFVDVDSMGLESSHAIQVKAG